MGKQIPIDDLFRGKLSNAEEQLNLGAWANMERMLDGKNPYAAVETKQKRRILPFLLFFTLVSGLLSAGYYKFSKHSQGSLAKVETTKSAPLASKLPTTDIATSTENNSDLKANDKLADDNNSNNSALVASDATNDKSNNRKIKNKLKSVKVEKNIANNIDIEKQQITPPIAEETLAKTEIINPIKNNKNQKNAIKKALIAKEDKSIVSQEKDFEKITTTKKEKINQIELTQNVTRNRNGAVDISFDTIAISKKEIEKEQVEFVVKDKTSNNEIENYHPRYKQLTKEEEANMTAADQLPIASLTPKVEIKENSKISTPSLTKAIESTQSKKPESQGFFDKLREFASNSYQKMTTAAVTALNLNTPAYTGLSLGVNAAIFNQKNNFGGFHIGVSNIKPINETFSILTELKFFLKNNSGYTIKDVSTQNKGVSVDNVTLASQNQSIYTYQMDSTVSGYNFKSFTSLEMPIMFQTHIGTTVIAYGGVNMAYNFKLNIKEAKTNYVVNKSETVDNTIAFYPAAELGKKYIRDDFAGRFGLGYTIGASYSFNPNIYLDLRLTKNVWDNAKTNTAKEIAGSYFTIPTIQFSLGYRFRKFDPKR